jgi:DNA replication protein DnaC
MITHLTTNLSSGEIEQYYGNRVRSRMREMFNVVGFRGGVRDKRR